MRFAGESENLKSPCGRIDSNKPQRFNRLFGNTHMEVYLQTSFFKAIVLPERRKLLMRIT
jgi:hypothetical protein